MALFYKDTLYQCRKSFCGVCEEAAPKYDSNRFHYWTKEDTLFLTAYGIICEQDSCWEQGILGIYRYSFQQVDSWDCDYTDMPLDGRCRLHLEWIAGEDVLTFLVSNNFIVRPPLACFRGWCE